MLQSIALKLLLPLGKGLLGETQCPFAGSTMPREVPIAGSELPISASVHWDVDRTTPNQCAPPVKTGQS